MSVQKGQAMEKKAYRCAAIVLAAGAGRRMQSEVKKQFLLIKDKPVVYYSLKAFEESFIDEVVLVTSEDDIDLCRKEIVEEYCFSKVKNVVAGGKERYHSVAAGLAFLPESDYVFIHDAARPMLTQEILHRAYACVQESKACVVGMPVKDTIKIADAQGYIAQTPDRNLVWMIQTPQVFEYALIKEAYEKLIAQEKELKDKGINITDDAMVVETLTKHSVKLVEGSYENIKITTPEDLGIAERFLGNI